MNPFLFGLLPQKKKRTQVVTPFVQNCFISYGVKGKEVTEENKKETQRGSATIHNRSKSLEETNEDDQFSAAASERLGVQKAFPGDELFPG